MVSSKADIGVLYSCSQDTAIAMPKLPSLKKSVISRKDAKLWRLRLEDCQPISLKSADYFSLGPWNISQDAREVFS